MNPNGRRAWRRAAKKLGAWFKRHGFTAQGLQKRDSPHPVRVYIGLWGTANGNGVEYAVTPKPFTARSLVGMTMGARKQAWDMMGYLRSDLRIGERLRPCPGCPECVPMIAVRQLRGWVTLSGLRLIPWKRIASDPCNGFTGHWSAGWTVHLQSGERVGGFWRDDNLSVARETAAQHCLIELRKALGSAPHCDGSGVLPARRS